MKKMILITTLLMVGLMATSAGARGLYFGAGIGNTFFSDEIDDAVDEVQEIDENSTSWKIFGGYNMISFLGVEGGYRDFGEIKYNLKGQAHTSSVNGWDISAMGRFTIAIVDVFGKAGAMFWESEYQVDELGGDDSGTDFLWGIGAGVHLGPIGVRVEWESLEVSGPTNLSMVSLGATLGF